MAAFDRSYTAKWQVCQVDESTWDDGGVLDGVVSASVSRDASDSVPLLETASFEVDADVFGDFEEGWYRLILVSVQNMVYERHAVSTVLVQKSSESISHGHSAMSLSGYSVLKPLEDRKNIGTDFKYVPKGSNGAEWVHDLISETSPAPVVVVGDGFKLNDDIVFSPGASYLSMIWSVLDSGKWCMLINGEGIISIVEKPKAPALVLDDTNVGHLVPGFTKSLDYSGVCNRYYSIDRDGTMEVAENHDPNSILSYENRGRWVDYVDTSPTKINGETLYRYTRRRLQEESTLLKSYSYTREYIPDILPFMIIDAELPAYGLQGELRVVSQQISCGFGITVNETAAQEIKEWIA